MSEIPPPIDSRRPPPLRPLPIAAPRSLRRHWRHRGGVITGAVIMLLALSTLYFRAPEDQDAPSPESEIPLPASPAPPPEMALPEQASPEQASPEEVPPEQAPPETTSPEQAAPEEALPEINLAPEVILPEEPDQPLPPAASPDSSPDLEERPALTGYVIQLAAARSEEAAQNHLRELQADHQDLLGNLSAEIQKAALAERGIFYRLYVGPFADREAAQNLCAALKEKGQDCFVRKL